MYTRQVRFSCGDSVCLCDGVPLYIVQVASALFPPGQFVRLYLGVEFGEQLCSLHMAYALFVAAVIRMVPIGIVTFRSNFQVSHKDSNIHILYNL